MKKTTLILLLTLGLLVLLGLLGSLYLLNAKTSNPEPKRLYLPEGSTYDALCDSLDAPHSFRLMAQVLKLDQHVRPGSYVVGPHMKQLALVRKLRNGQQDPIRLTIGKFRTPDQLNNYLNQKLMHDDFDIPLDSFYIVRPDTYEFYWTVTPAQFMQRMEREWRTESGKWKVESGERRTENGERVSTLSTFHFPLSTKEVIILASIVEEETNNNAEKPLIASVYLNRLERGIPLQADPTVKYAVGDFTLRRILNKHLATENPFNTYLHPGLPPAPICLPSKASVEAVLNAPQTGYLYFCASDRLDGTHRFAATLAEHNRNAAAFHRALDSRGIR
ncbi:MAG: endolytic transglycosylase MltG [Bacteroidales bacterium]|nr:endolytic transglycosylase MltG [Bacteroidales bacterium]